MANDAFIEMMQDDSDAAWSEHYQEVSEAFDRIRTDAMRWAATQPQDYFNETHKAVDVVYSELGIK